MNDGHGQLTVSSGIRETGDKYEVTLEIEEAHSWILVYLYLPLGKFSKEKKAAGWVDFASWVSKPFDLTFQNLLSCWSLSKYKQKFIL